MFVLNYGIHFSYITAPGIMNFLGVYENVLQDVPKKAYQRTTIMNHSMMHNCHKSYFKVVGT